MLEDNSAKALVDWVIKLLSSDFEHFQLLLYWAWVSLKGDSHERISHHLHHLIKLFFDPVALILFESWMILYFILFHLIQQYSSNTTYNNYSIYNTNDVYITYKATPNPP